jgi:hypothetical protein
MEKLPAGKFHGVTPGCTKLFRFAVSVTYFAACREIAENRQLARSRRILQRLRGLHVDDQVNPGGLHDLQVGGFGEADIYVSPNPAGDSKPVDGKMR